MDNLMTKCIHFNGIFLILLTISIIILILSAIIFIYTGEYIQLIFASALTIFFVVTTIISSLMMMRRNGQLFNSNNNHNHRSDSNTSESELNSRTSISTLCNGINCAPTPNSDLPPSYSQLFGSQNVAENKV